MGRMTQARTEERSSGNAKQTPVATNFLAKKNGGVGSTFPPDDQGVRQGRDPNTSVDGNTDVRAFIVLHELGHALAFERFGTPLRSLWGLLDYSWEYSGTGETGLADARFIRYRN